MGTVNCFNYWPGPHTIIGDVKARLPDHIRGALMKGSVHADCGIYVEAANSEIVSELDNCFRSAGRERLERTVTMK